MPDLRGALKPRAIEPYKGTRGGRGMGAIAVHLRYIVKAGRLPIEDDRAAVREGKESLRAIADPWRFSGTSIQEVSERCDAFNIMLSMPTGTDALRVQQAAREFDEAALANHRDMMVLHTHLANTHVHIGLRAEGRDGRRLSPLKEDLHRGRETFAERLRSWGFRGGATSQVTRGRGIATSECGNAKPAFRARSGRRRAGVTDWHQKAIGTGLGRDRACARVVAGCGGSQAGSVDQPAPGTHAGGSGHRPAPGSAARAAGHELGRSPMTLCEVRSAR